MSGLKKLLRERAGNVLVLAGLSMPLIIGFAGLATDTIQWTLAKRELQRSADSAALAGAYTIAQDGDAVAGANDSLTLTNKLTLTGLPVIENAPNSGAYSGDQNAIYVELNSQMKLPFSSIFLATGPTMSAKATAALLNDGNFCVISLDDSSDVGVTATGSANIDLNCGIFANSRGPNGVSVGGAGNITTDIVGSVGGLAPSSSYQPDTRLIPYMTRQADPFANITDPSPSGCVGKVTVNPNQSRSLTPGCYRGIDVKGTVSFAPGIYYIDGGSLSFGAQAVVTGTEVTFVLTSATAASNPSSIATLSINGGASLDLSPPSSGTYTGVLIYKDRRAPSTTTRINGNSTSVLEGSFYFPSDTLIFNGNSGMTTDCVQLISFKVEFSGNSAISNNCPTNGANSFRGTTIRLVS